MASGLAPQKSCPRCGTANPPHAAFCLACSQSLAARDVEPTIVGRGVTAVASSAEATVIRSETQRTSGDAAVGLATSAVLLPDTDIGHRYRVLRIIGHGGMGIVYLVHDRALDRNVALKVIRSEIAGDPAALDRFKREIHLSSTVTHKNVLRVYDLGEADGLTYLTMEFVEGDDLATILAREPRLPIPRALAIFRQICAGLAAAHEKGVVHRDLKPQNVMVDASGQVFLTDFGLATARQVSGLTQTGAVLGTPFYMSPEQIKGEPVDGRSDIYALGIILYQLVTGQLPFSGGTPYEVMSRRLYQPPQPASELNPELPPYLQLVIDRCLAVSPAARYATADQVQADLDAATFTPAKRPRRASFPLPRLLLVGVALVLLVGAAVAGWFAWQRSRADTDRARAPVSVLVADFENRTGDVVFDGTLEPAFGVALEGASFVTSYNRGAAQGIANQLQPGAVGISEALARLVAQREGVAVVTAGAVERDGAGYRIHVRAVDAVTGAPIVEASDSVSSKEGVLAAVTRVAATVRRAFGDSTPESTQISAAETFTAASLEAAHDYAVAQQHSNDGRWDEAIAAYRKAIAQDPHLGRAYAGLAVTYSNIGRRDEAIAHYREAMARIGRMSDREKFRTRGAYYLVTRQPDKAIEELTALVQQYPADSAGLANLAVAHYLKRDMTRALEVGRRALAIYPKAAPLRNNVGLFAMYAGDFPTAIREQQRVIAEQPEFVSAYVGLALAQLGAGEPDAAIATWRRLAEMGKSGASSAAIGLADLALYQGRTADARAILPPAIAADLENQDPDAAAVKLTVLGAAELTAGNQAAAVDAVDRARHASRADNVALHAALILADAGEERRALSIAAELETRLEPDPRMFAHLVRGEVALGRGQGRDALAAFREAQAISDSWLGRFGIGRAYLAAKAYPEAHSELEQCVRRRGEATAVLIDEVPTYRLFPQVYHFLGRAHEGLGSPASADSYRTLLAMKTADDPLAADARRKLGLEPAR